MLAAESMIELAACRAVLARAADLIDATTRPARRRTEPTLSCTGLFAEAQAAKAFISQAAPRIVDRALALSGGAGYLNGSPLARAYRDVRAGAFMHPLGDNRAYEFLGQVAARPGAGAPLSAMRTTGTIIIGAGQAGLALSRYLSGARHEHVLLERGRVGERWRSERWDSLALLTPNRFSELPGFVPHAEPDGFLSRDAFVGYLEEYARSFSAPVLEGVSVLQVAQAPRGGFRVGTDSGAWNADNVVLATGYADEPLVPAVAAAAPDGLIQLHSSRYRSPGRMPPGGVLIVGAGPSGQQLAAELRRTGRRVVLAVGRHARMPRRYRGHDIWHWLTEMGSLEHTLADVPHERERVAVAEPGAERRRRGRAARPDEPRSRRRGRDGSPARLQRPARALRRRPWHNRRGVRPAHAPPPREDRPSHRRLPELRAGGRRADPAGDAAAAGSGWSTWRPRRSRP